MSQQWDVCVKTLFSDRGGEYTSKEFEDYLSRKGIKHQLTMHYEEFALGIDPKSLHATVLMQTVYNTVVRHSGGFLLKHVAISDTERVKITAA